MSIVSSLSTKLRKFNHDQDGLLVCIKCFMLLRNCVFSESRTIQYSIIPPKEK